MDDLMKKACERFYSEFTQMYSEAASKDKWTKDCVETMKDLLKCIYYCEVIEAMHNPEEYEREAGFSTQKRNSMGQFSRTGGNMSYRGGNGNGGNGGYSGMYPMSTRRFYSYDDGGHQAAMSRLQSIMNNEPNEEVRMLLQDAMNEISMR